MNVFCSVVIVGEDYYINFFEYFMGEDFCVFWSGVWDFYFFNFMVVNFFVFDYIKDEFKFFKVVFFKRVGFC